MALRTQRVAPQFLAQLNSIVPGTGRTVAETMGFRPVSTEQNLGAPLAGFKTPVALSAEERIFGRPNTLEDKPLPPLFGGTFEQGATPVGTPQASGAGAVGLTTLGPQTGFTPGTPVAELARVLSANANTAAGAVGTTGAVLPDGVLGTGGGLAGPSPGSLAFTGVSGGTPASGTSIAFGTLPPATRSFFTGDLDRPDAGAGRRRLAGQLVRRVRDSEPQGAVLQTRPLSSLQPRRRASVDPVKKRLLNTLVR